MGFVNNERACLKVETAKLTQERDVSVAKAEQLRDCMLDILTNKRIG